MRKKTKLLTAFLGVLIIMMGTHIILRTNPKLLKNSLLGQVGVMVGVEPNPYNSIAQQLDEKEKELVQKEEELKIREETLNTEAVNINEQLLYLIIGVAGVLFVLLGTNFYLDWRRKQI
ncbi:hypothetical protein CL629_00690 [bacterium]|nr:hypothetical protein [bacterium]|tara:strand:- start:722 stop:1078 length:357 start_codon:yes stop_codon:yes gene_type:complete